MKLTISIAILSAFAASAPLLAAEQSTTERSVEQQFRDVDIALAIEQYKKLMKEVLDIRIKVAVEKLSEQEQEQMLTRMEKLNRMADGMRFQALEYGEKAKQTSEKNTSFSSTP